MAISRLVIGAKSKTVGIHCWVATQSVLSFNKFVVQCATDSMIFSQVKVCRRISGVADLLAERLPPYQQQRSHAAFYRPQCDALHGRYVGRMMYVGSICEDSSTGIMVDRRRCPMLQVGANHEHRDGNQPTTSDPSAPAARTVSVQNCPCTAMAGWRQHLVRQYSSSPDLRQVKWGYNCTGVTPSTALTSAKPAFLLISTAADRGDNDDGHRCGEIWW